MPLLIAVSLIAALGAGGLTAGYLRSDLYRLRRAARRPLVQMQKAARRARAAVGPLLRKLHKAARAHAAGERAAHFRETPIEELRRHGAHNVRWSALDDAGIETVGDLSTRSAAGLDRLPGVGPVTAGRVSRAAKGLRRELRDEPVEVPGVEGWATATVKPLVRAAWPVLDNRPHIDRADRLALETATATRRFGGIRQRTRFRDWLLRRGGPETIEQLQSDVQEQIDHVGRLQAAGLLARQPGPRAARPPRDQQLEQDFRDRYAEYASVLEDALSKEVPGRTPAGLSLRGVHRGLPEEIARRVEAFPLNASGLDVTLRRYQRFGAKYMLAQERTLLGDEMGLGKTIQALATIVHLDNDRQGRHFLVVCPASIIRNWAREVDDRTALPLRLLFGDERDEDLGAWLDEGGVALTSYATLRSLGLAGDLEGQDIRLALLVVDEAHYAKNPSAGRTQALLAVSARADRIALMTGTPLENDLEEFKRIIALASDQIAAQVTDRSTGFRGLASTVAPVYLRRNQKDVLRELPDRIEKQEWLDLDPTDGEAYRASVLERNYMAMRRSVTVGDGSGSSAKLDHLAELVDEYRALERKVLVFSFFLDVLALVAKRFGAIGTVEGRLSPDRRMALIDDFRAEDGFALLASQIQAGGVGLNLQAASVVVLMEPQWKPSTEEQAIARAHRMGQTEHVIVHRMLARNTVDEHMVELLAEKKETFDRYVRESALKQASREATEAGFAERVIEAELAKLTATGGGEVAPLKR
ncbi:MAG: DEAD/DEAH box helicase [Planctomycetota bacterium]